MKSLSQLKKQLLLTKKQRGLTLVEVGLAVAISAVIVIGVLYMYNSTETSTAVYQFNNDMTNIRSAVSTYRQTTGEEPTSIGDLISDGYLTLGNSTDGTGADPWGGTYTFVAGTGTPVTDYTIKASNPTKTACPRLISQWTAVASATPTCTSSAGFSANFDL